MRDKFPLFSIQLKCHIFFNKNIFVGTAETKVYFQQGTEQWNHWIYFRDNRTQEKYADIIIELPHICMFFDSFGHPSSFLSISNIWKFIFTHFDLLVCPPKQAEFLEFSFDLQDIGWGFFSSSYVKFSSHCKSGKQKLLLTVNPEVNRQEI